MRNPFECAKSILEIVHQSVEPYSCTAVANGLLYLLHAPDSKSSFAMGLVGEHSRVLLRAHLDLALDFIVQILFQRSSASEIPPKGS